MSGFIYDILHKALIFTIPTVLNSIYDQILGNNYFGNCQKTKDKDHNYYFSDINRVLIYSSDKRFILCTLTIGWHGT